MELINEAKRKGELISSGIPKEFLANIGKIKELSNRVEGVEGSYFYLPTLKEYEILKIK